MTNHSIEWIGVQAVAAEEPDVLQKIAQRRNFLQWLHEKANVPRKVVEHFSSEYGKQMAQLREVDDALRFEARMLASDLGQARRALKERRYVDVAHFAGNINDDLKRMREAGSVLISFQQSQMDEFYGHQEHADVGRDYFKAEAGLSDVFHGIGRMYSGHVIERMYKKQLKQRHKAIGSLVDLAEALVNQVLRTLKEMGTLRARGDVGSYITNLKNIEKRRSSFEELFKNIYQSQIAPMIQRMQEQQSKQEAVEPEWPSFPVSAPDVPVAEQTVPAVEPQVTDETPLTVTLMSEPTAAEQPAAAEQQVVEPSAVEPAPVASPEVAAPPVEVPPAAEAAPPQEPEIIYRRPRPRATPVPKKPRKSRKKASDIEFGLFMLKYAAELDSIGRTEQSLKALAIAEGFLDDA